MPSPPHPSLSPRRGERVEKGWRGEAEPYPELGEGGSFRLAITLTACLAPLLAACADKAPAPDPTISVYGMSQAQLAACAGAPATRSTLADVDYLTYRTTLVVGRSALADLPKIPVIGSLAFGDPGHKVECEATVVLRAGRVDSVSYRTAPPQNAPQAAQICRPILQACLPSGQGGS
jgi:hypothetical protein